MANIQIEKEYDDMLNQLKGRLNKSKKHIVENAIRYIHLNKINPENTKTGDPTAELKHLRNELISFIKTQEKTKLDPMLHKLAVVADKVYEKADQGLTVDLLKKEFHQVNVNYKQLAEYFNRLTESTHKQAPILSKQMTDLKTQFDTLSQIVDQKLSKKIL